MTEMQVRALVQQIDDLFRGPEASSKAKLRETINKITNAEVSIAKPAMLHLARVSTHEMSDDLFKETSEMALAAISEQHMHSVYDESDNIFRTRLFDILIAEEKFSDAADVLGQLNLDSQIYIYSADEKANIHIKCAESFLEEEESVRAEGHIDRIHREDIMSEVVDQILTLRYKVTHARVLDANRRFVEASRRYFDVSSTKEAGLNQDDLIELLSKAVTCAILGKIGPQHTRLIRVLSKDERLPQLEMIPAYKSAVQILKKMNEGMLLEHDEITEFEKSLAPHQRAMGADGLSVVARAVVQHNMTSCSRIYDNIKLDELAARLHLESRMAMKICMAMIMENRLDAVIDQVEQLLVFRNDTDPFKSWDRHISHVCLSVMRCSSLIRNL